MLTTLATCTTPPPVAPVVPVVVPKPAVRSGHLPPPAAPTDAATLAVAARLALLGQPDVLLLGEQHDATEHHRLHLAVVQALASSGQLAAVVLEMADSGQHTRNLGAQSSDCLLYTSRCV